MTTEPAPEAVTGKATGKATGEVADGFARRDPRWGELERLRLASRMLDAVIDEVRGRRIRVGDHWLADFASCNYLGFDFDAEIIASLVEEVRRWGTHPSWSRLLGNPRLYPEIEETLTELLGCDDTLLLPTITHIHSSVLPILAGEGQILLDAQAHKTLYDAATTARASGATVRRFRTNDPDHLTDLLRLAPARSARVVCMDGVHSMTGNPPDVPLFARICREHGALLYLDDAHGFGILGERRADETSAYGTRGNGSVRYFGESYQNVVLVGGFSKAYSSLLAFIAVPRWLKDHLKVAAPPYLYSGPSPTASLASTLAGLRVNAARGDTVRAELHRKTRRVLDHLGRLAVHTPNRTGTPIVEIPLADARDIDTVAELLWDRGIYVTLAAYPLVPRAEVGFRVQVTALNGDDEIDELLAALTELAERSLLRGAA
ncbi:MAG TPA: pyridoxal phosphate-dependent aminotransferase family protein [Cryptosporangiaceae bacterium]|nr:pyridoxal phosphate-dependent aminotransferase family protein [Cryptosporangiaceae bacterium]